jgi:hypothetical protein
MYVICVLFVHSGVQHILCFVYPVLPISLDLLFCIAPSVFSKIYVVYVILCDMLDLITSQSLITVYTMLLLKKLCLFEIASYIE